MTAPTTGERFARLETIVEQSFKRLEEKMDAANSRLEELDKRTGALEVDFLKAKIGWKTLVTIGGFLMTIAGTVGAMIAKYLPFLGAAPR
jgi:hypothetical protein